MTQTTIGPPPENSLLVFGGTADIDEANLRAQLDHWLPKGIDVAVALQQAIPRGPKGAGLKKILAWLREEFPFDDDEEDPIERPADLLKFITDLEDTDDTYLVLLTVHDNSNEVILDEATEKLIDLCSRRGVIVLDLTDGLDELKLSNKPPEPESEPEDARAGRRTRRGRRASTADASRDQASGTTEDSTPPWNTDHDIPATDLQAERSLAYAQAQAYYSIAEGYRMAALALEKFAGVTADELLPGTPAKTAAGKTETTRTWLLNPALPDNDPGAYQLKGRGRPRNAMKDWQEVHLTPAREKEIGLAG
jgi:hypothetical protein